MGKDFSHKGHLAWLKTLPKKSAGASMIIQNPAGELLVVKANYKRYWSLPGGVIDEKESPRQAAIREVSEEVGINVKPEEAEFLKVIYYSSDEIDTYKFVFKASISQDVSRTVVLQESEIDDFDFVSKEAVQNSDRIYGPEIVEWAAGTLSGYGEIDRSDGVTQTS